MTRLPILAALVTILTIPCSARSQQADERAPQADSKKKAESLREMTALIDATTLKVILPNGTAQEATRIEKPVFRYSDEPVFILDSTLWVWKHDGRPVAIQKIENNAFSKPVGWTYCFASLAPSDRVRVDWPNAADYQSSAPGVKLKPVPDAPQPATQKAARDRQMRAIARRFTCNAYHGAKKRKYKSLRPLPRPILEYSEEKNGIATGAIFAFATGTNPNALLLIEASSDGEQQQPQWRYAGVQMTSGGLQLKYQDVEVWTANPEPRPRHFPNWTYMWMRK